MKIVQYMLGFRNADGGVVRALIDLCNMLAARGHEVRVLTTDASDAPKDWDGRDGRPSLRTLGFHRIGEGVLTRRAKGVVRTAFLGADVIHLHVPWDMICLQMARIARRMRLPYVVTVHGMLDDWTMQGGSLKKRLYLALGGRAFLERAAAVQAAARIEAEQSQKRCPRGRSTVIPLLVDLDEFRNLPGPELARERFPQAFASGRRVLYLGRIHPIKRIGSLIGAVAALVRQGMDVRLLLAGAGEAAQEQAIREAIALQGLQGRAMMLGFIGGELKRSLCQAADVAVLPSVHESFGLALVEAMACGTPGICTKGANVWPELQATGGAAIVETEGTALESGLAEAIRSALADEDQRRRMGRAAREGVFRWLDPERLIGQYEEMYRQAMRSR